VSASYVIILPVMLANLLAYLVARKLNPVTFFEMVAAQDGLQLPSLERQRDVRRLRVEDAMRATDANGPLEAGPVVHPDQALDTALQMFGERTVLPVVSRQDVTRRLGELSLKDVLHAYGIVGNDAPAQRDSES
jgi:CIC family chloride channel protein